MPRLSVAICTYDRYDHLPAAIASVLDPAGTTDDVELIVVDNSPPGAARDEAAARHAGPGVRYLTVDTPGLANARNVAVAHARADLVAFLDDDAVAGPGWAGALIDAFARCGSAAAVGGPVDPVFGAPRPPWLHDRLLPYVTAIDWGPEERPLREGEWLVGANVAYRRSAYLAAGGCNVALGRIGGGNALLSNEETELGERLRRAGGLHVYCPAARVRHLIPAGRLTRSWFRRRAMWQAVSDQMMGPLPAGEAAALMQGVGDYAVRVPPRERSLRALFHDTDDPELFYWQVQSVYAFYRATLSEGAAP
jgi:GT2 family glycosyltransferase